MMTGFTLSLLLECARLMAETEFQLLEELPSEARTLEGEHDCRLGLPSEPDSVEPNLPPDAPALPLDAEADLSGFDVFKFVGALSEIPGISAGFCGLDLTVGELPRDDTVPFDVVGTDFTPEEERPGGAVAVVPDFATEEDRAGAADAPDPPEALDALDGVGVDDRRDGVDDLDVALEAVADDLVVGVEERAVDLLGVEGLTGGAVSFVEGNVAREVGVEGLEDFDVAGKVGLPVGVAGLLTVDFGPPDDKGLLFPVPEEFSAEDITDCLVESLILEAGCGWKLDTFKSKKYRK